MNWTGTDKAQSNWFFTRLSAKDAVRAAWNERHGGGIFPADMEADVVDGRFVYVARAARRRPSCFPRCASRSRTAGSPRSARSRNELGIALAVVAKNAPPEAEQEVRGKTACGAVADALRVPGGELPAGFRSTRAPARRSSKWGKNGFVFKPHGRRTRSSRLLFARRSNRERRTTSWGDLAASGGRFRTAISRRTSTPPRGSSATSGLASIDLVVLAEQLDTHFGRRLPFGTFLKGLRDRGGRYGVG